MDACKRVEVRTVLCGREGEWCITMVCGCHIVCECEMYIYIYMYKIKIKEKQQFGIKVPKFSANAVLRGLFLTTEHGYKHSSHNDSKIPGDYKTWWIKKIKKWLRPNYNVCVCVWGGGGGGGKDVWKEGGDV